MILKPISLILNGVLDADDVYLPLTNADAAKLTAFLPEDGDSTYLTISDGADYEFILVTNQSGTMVLTRGVDSEAKKWPTGSCVFFETSVPVVKWLICNHQCCTEDCEPTAVAAAGSLLPEAKVNYAWSGSFMFTGDLPMVFGITGLPDWCTAVYKNNFVLLTGTPTAAAEYTISVCASNSNGASVAVQQGTIKVTA